MRRHLSIILCVFVCTAIYAQQDASTVYASFARNSSILKTAAPHSDEYEAAKQEMLRLYPQLQYHAARYSQNKQTTNAITFAKAYVDMAMMPQFEELHLEKSEQYPSMTYFLASNYYNRKDYTNAAAYLQRYIDLNTDKNRPAVYLFLAKSYELLQDTRAEMNVMERALEEYPANKDLLAFSINVRMENGWYSEALPYIDRALEINRGDSKLLSCKGQCYEALQRYEEAADIYALLAEQMKSLGIYKHYAVNLFNCAVQYYPTNKSYAVSYIQRSIPVLKQVVANDPTSVPFTNALAMAYLYTDQYDLLAQTNDRLRALGAKEVEAGSATDPVMLASDLKRPSKSASQPVVKPQNTVPQPSTPVPQPSANNNSMGFKAFAQNYVEKEIQLWQQKDPFETIDEYKTRVTEQTRAKKVDELMAEAKKQYIARQEKKIRISDFTLQPYDAENRVFLIQSKYGDIVLPVPRENDEARNFSNTWKQVHIEHPEFDVAGDQMVIRAADFVTRNGMVYHYSDKDEMKYSQAQIALQFDDIDYSRLDGTGGQRSKVQVQQNTVTVGSSDVDINIPENKTTHSDKFAFLIGNENYQQIAPVPFALHDVRTMKQYCNKTLGIPETNIRVYEDATFGKLLSCMRDIKAIADAYNGEIDIIFYYAGHGVPDEASKSAYLLPVDADGIQKESCFPVGRLYSDLGSLGARSVIVMMDACFSGAKRGEGMIASARGVALKAKPDAPQGRMVTVSAATGEETAYPYDEKQHGMFTYYLLKAMQENKGKLTLGELTRYVQTQVRQQSVVINHKSQTPTIHASPEAADWQNWKLR